jgi:hypothetical protein
MGDRWGQDIPDTRKQELAETLRAWEADPDHGERRGPFDRQQLTGADVCWLAEQVCDKIGDVSNLHLEGARLSEAQLHGADLVRAHLEGADLGYAHLEGTNLDRAQLQGASLRVASLDGKTELANVTLGEPCPPLARLLRRKAKWGNASLGDIRWAGPPDLTQVPWETLQRLGDEDRLGWRSSVADNRNVVRAYRQVAAQLRAQGLSEEADRFAERAQIRKRKQTFREMLVDWRRPWRLPGDLLRWLFSWFLAILAGYGYHPGRSVFWYLATIAGFAFAYYQLGPAAGHAFQPDGAVVFSLTSFHGRGFFPGGLDIESIVTKLAAIEAVIGLLIEISFIATFTQRFFSSK